MENEKLWYQIPGFCGYFANEQGEIKSVKMWVKHPQGYLIKTYTDKNGDYVFMQDDGSSRRKMYIKDILEEIEVKKSRIMTLRDGESYSSMSRKFKYSERPPIKSIKEKFLI